MALAEMAPKTQTPLLQINEVTVRFGGLTALDKVTTAVHPGLITALIGPNGAGKSTLLNVITGFQRPTEGRVLFDGRDVTAQPAHARVGLGMARTFQDMEVLPRLTVLENVLLGLQGQPGEQLWRLFLTPCHAWRQQRAAIERALDILKLVGVKDKADELCCNLSFGDQKLVVLARLLATDATMFMLDEPGAGLPSRQIDQLGVILQQMVDVGKTVLLVDHNMRLVMSYAHWVVVLHHGRLIAAGTPDQIRTNPEVVQIYLTG